MLFRFVNNTVQIVGTL